MPVYYYQALDQVKKQIVPSPDAIEIRRFALGTAMKSLLYHGTQLILNRVTSVAELTRGFEEQ